MPRFLSLLWAALLLLPPLRLAAAAAADGWQVMPEGARPTYIGIHGGTVPVSLLVSPDGSSLVSFVGRTGNDFLEILHRSDVRMPSLLNNATGKVSSGHPATTVLLAGHDDRRIMVFYIIGDGATRTAFPMSELEPFGLSRKPLSVEGSVGLPAQRNASHPHRLNLDTDYLQPRRAGS